MKKIMTIASLIVLMVGFASHTKAQFSVGANAGIAIPTGSFQQTCNMGFGGYLTAAYSLNDKMSIGFNAGIYSFNGTDFPAGHNPSALVIPLFLDFKYFLNTEGFMPYVGTGLGVYMVTAKHTTPATPAKTAGGVVLEPAQPITDHSASTQKFGVSPTVGFWLGEEFKYGASASYHITISDASYVSINIGVIYSFGE